jgi:hypothetical protein
LPQAARAKVAIRAAIRSLFIAWYPQKVQRKGRQITGTDGPLRRYGSRLEGQNASPNIVVQSETKTKNARGVSRPAFDCTCADNLGPALAHQGRARPVYSLENRLPSLSLHHPDLP